MIGPEALAARNRRLLQACVHLASLVQSTCSTKIQELELVGRLAVHNKSASWAPPLRLHSSIRRLPDATLIINDRASLHKAGFDYDHSQHRRLYRMLVRGDRPY